MTSSTVCATAVYFSRYLFTGKERDSESGNDYFEARYYASSMGRFMSPDWSSYPMAVPYADFRNPQSLNLFVYALDNPLNRFDLDGHDWRTLVQQAKQWAADHPRTVLAMKAAAAAAVTTLAVVAVVATAPVSVPATLTAAAVSALVTATATIAATGGAVATVTYTAAAIAGSQGLGKAGDAVKTITNPAGFVNTVATGGNTEAGGVAASTSDLLTGDPVAAIAGAADLTTDFLSAAAEQAGQDQTEQPPMDFNSCPDPVLPPTQQQDRPQQYQPK
jgi:RHS repeat-associated protein